VYGHRAYDRQRSVPEAVIHASVRIAAILGIAVAAAMSGAAAKAACPAKSPYRCVDTGPPLNLNSVPDVARKIVSEEPISAKQDKPASEPAAPAPYTGPIVGVTSGKPAPTVGYSWSLQ
jgi:hypothetical protein